MPADGTLFSPNDAAFGGAGSAAVGIPVVHGREDVNKLSERRAQQCSGSESDVVKGGCDEREAGG